VIVNKGSLKIGAIASILRRARRERREKQADVARRAGISQQIVSRIERGEGGLEGLVLLARAIGLEVELRVGSLSLPLAHGIDPEERREIDANIAWFSRLPPAKRLRTIRLHAASLDRLRKAARAPDPGRDERGERGA
jgi:transcriptional regulator with XRE-family HTH domain